MRPALLALLAALLAFAPLAAAQAGDAGDAGLVGPAPWTAEEANLDLASLGDEAPSVALDDLAGPLTAEAGARALEPNGPVFPTVGGYVPTVCLLGTFSPAPDIGGCFTPPGLGSHPRSSDDNESGEAASSAEANATVAPPVEEMEGAQRTNESAALGMGPASASPSDPVPAPTSSHGGVPSRRAPASLQVAPAPSNSLSWQIATAAFALPGALLAKLASILVLRRRAGDTSPTMRDAVLEAIAAHPGVRHRELVRRIGRGNGTVEHHVRRLVADGKVARLRVGASTAYALAGDLSAQEAGLRLALEGRTSRRLALDVAAHPGSRLTEVALRVGVSLATAHYQAGKLVAAGILRDVAGAGGRRLEPTPAGRACLVAVTAEGPAVASPFGAPLGLRAMASSA